MPPNNIITNHAKKSKSPNTQKYFNSTNTRSAIYFKNADCKTNPKSNFYGLPRLTTTPRKITWDPQTQCMQFFLKFGTQKRIVHVYQSDITSMVILRHISAGIMRNYYGLTPFHIHFCSRVPCR